MPTKKIDGKCQCSLMPSCHTRGPEEGGGISAQVFSLPVQRPASRLHPSSGSPRSPCSGTRGSGPRCSPLLPRGMQALPRSPCGLRGWAAGAGGGVGLESPAQPLPPPLCPLSRSCASAASAALATSSPACKAASCSSARRPASSSASPSLSRRACCRRPRPRSAW